VIEIRKLGGPLGAEVNGWCPGMPISAEDFRRVNQAFLDNLVLRFHGPVVSPAEFRDFARNFGPLRPHVAKSYRDREFPEIVMMTNQDADGNFDPVGAGRGLGWHSDGTFEPLPPKGTMLHAQAIPDSGGNTLFANTYLAYDRMPEKLRSRIEPLTARFRLRGRKTHTQGIVTAVDMAKMHDVFHPVVRVNPETGRKAVFVNPHHTVCIEGVTDADSEALLAEIFAWCTREEFQWQQQWRVGDTVIWENRAAWHCGRDDYPKHQLRKFMRTTICDPTGPIPAVH
jgi:taurine dioxygenase